MPAGCRGREHETLVTDAGRDAGRAALTVLEQARAPR